MHQRLDQNPDCGGFGVGLWLSLCGCKKLSSNFLFDEPLRSGCWAPDDPTPTLMYDLHTGKYRNARSNSKRPILYSRINPGRAHGACEITRSACQTLSWSSCPFPHPMHAPCPPAPVARPGVLSEGRASLPWPLPLPWYGWPFTAEPPASVQIKHFRKQKGNQVHPLPLVTFRVRLLRPSLLWDLSVSINFLLIPFLPFQPSSNQLLT